MVILVLWSVIAVAVIGVLLANVRIRRTVVVTKKTPVQKEPASLKHKRIDIKV